jgi:hypothetical protein
MTEQDIGKKKINTNDNVLLKPFIIASLVRLDGTWEQYKNGCVGLQY